MTLEEKIDLVLRSGKAAAHLDGALRNLRVVMEHMQEAVEADEDLRPELGAAALALQDASDAFGRATRYLTERLGAALRSEDA